MILIYHTFFFFALSEHHQWLDNDFSSNTSACRPATPLRRTQEITYFMSNLTEVTLSHKEDTGQCEDKHADGHVLMETKDVGDGVDRAERKRRKTSEEAGGCYKKKKKLEADDLLWCPLEGTTHRRRRRRRSPTFRSAQIFIGCSDTSCDETSANTVLSCSMGVHDRSKEEEKVEL